MPTRNTPSSFCEMSQNSCFIVVYCSSINVAYPRKTSPACVNSSGTWRTISWHRSSFSSFAMCELSDCWVTCNRSAARVKLRSRANIVKYSKVAKFIEGPSITNRICDNYCL